MTRSGFAAADWLLAGVTVLTIVIVWHEYLSQVSVCIWLPTWLGSLVPFGVVLGGSAPPWNRLLANAQQTEWWGEE